MKRYSLIIIHPGMSRYDTSVRADGFYAEEGGYYFYNNVTETHDPGATQNTIRETKCVYPINITIIREIE